MTDPDVLFLIDWIVGVQINHFWCAVRWSGIPRYLKRINAFKKNI